MIGVWMLRRSWKMVLCDFACDSSICLWNRHLSQHVEIILSIKKRNTNIDRYHEYLLRILKTLSNSKVFQFHDDQVRK